MNNQNGNGNSSENGSGNNGGGTVSWGIKAGYVGTGILIGLIAYPFVRKALSKIQPKADAFFDKLTGKAEEFAEKASDLMAKAKENLAKTDDHEGHDHSKQGSRGTSQPGTDTVQ